jgi:hypothetical protein
LKSASASALPIRRKRRRRRVGAAIAIGLAFTIGVVSLAGGASLIWGGIAALATGAVTWGASFFVGGGANGTDLDEGAGLGLSNDGDLGDV